MTTQQGVPTIQVLVGPDKESVNTRLACGVRITGTAPKSPLYQSQQEVKDATDAVTTQTADLQTAMEAFFTAEAAYELAKSTLGSSVVGFDRVYNVFVAVAEKFCKTEADGATLAVAIRKGTKHALAMPVSIDAKYNPRKDWIHIHVHRAPGTSSLRVEVSPDQINWQELPGDGAIHTIPDPAPGTYSIRALSQSAREKSEYTTPISVTVR
jgi:hypothetical protein